MPGDRYNTVNRGYAKSCSGIVESEGCGKWSISALTAVQWWSSKEGEVGG